MSFWKPGTIAPGSTELVSRISSEEDREIVKESQEVILNVFSKRSISIQQQRLMLPVYQHRLQILYAVEHFQVVVIVGETGCGKTTQIPQYLHEVGWTIPGQSIVACTQPRRVAAVSVAQRVAAEMGVPLGKQVGYAIQFDDCTDSETTVIKYMTDGLLLRETMLDPLLSKYSVIMIDEAHERSLHTDILLGLLKKIIKRRKELRVIVSSATLDAEDVRRFFSSKDHGNHENTTIMSIEGRMFPVDIHFRASPVADYLRATVDTVLDIHKFQGPGDILAFLTGQEEIDKAVTLIKEKANDISFQGSMRLRVMPMYSGLPYDQIMRAFEPPQRNTRKVIVSTNIAETSVTIDGIVYVIDCGFVKIRAYHPRLGIDTLLVTPVSQAAAKQRAGRAGRNRPGKCYRLYTEEDYCKLAPAPIPEMQRTNLSWVVLQLKSLGIDNIMNFDFMSPPPVDHMIRALEILYSLGALDDDCKLTDPIGTIMAEFPIEPYMAKMLISSGKEYQCSEEILSIAAMLSIQGAFSFSHDQRHSADAAKRKFAVYEGDHLTLLNVFNLFLKHGRSAEWCRAHFLNYKALLRACQIRNQLKKYLRRWNVPLTSSSSNPENIIKAIVSGFFANAARLQSTGQYRMIRGGQEMRIHPMSILANHTPEWVIFHEVVQTTEVHMREVTVIQPRWLAEIAPHFYEFSTKSEQHQQQYREELQEVNSAQPTKKLRTDSVF